MRIPSTDLTCHDRVGNIEKNVLYYALAYCPRVGSFQHHWYFPCFSHLFLILTLTRSFSALLLLSGTLCRFLFTTLCVLHSLPAVFSLPTLISSFPFPSSLGRHCVVRLGTPVVLWYRRCACGGALDRHVGANELASRCRCSRAQCACLACAHSPAGRLSGGAPSPTPRPPSRASEASAAQHSSRCSPTRM